MKSKGMATKGATALALILTPHGRLLLEPVDDAVALSSDLSRRLRTAFTRGSGHGLLQLGAAEVGTILPPVFGYWREFGARYVSAVCGQQDLDTSRSHISAGVPAARSLRGGVAVGPPLLDELEKLAAAAPPMLGADYLTPTVLAALWHELGAAFQFELAESKTSVQDFLRRKSPAWHVVGRVHFNLAENRLDAEAPFAFLATYTARLSGHAKAQHLPLGRALTEYAGATNRSRLLSLLLPVQQAAAQCGWLKTMVDSGEIFHPLRWTPAEAYQLLTDLSRLEAAGVIVRVPGTWRANRPSRPQVSAIVGAKPPMGLGTDALLDFRMDVTLEGERLTAPEIDELLAASDGLHFVRGRWVEVDRAKLGRMLDEFRAVEKVAKENGLDFAAAMRLLAGARVSGDEQLDVAAADWSRVIAGPWLAKTLEALRHPEALARIDPGDELKTILRPYQQAGVRWLHLLSSLGLGACLADDMGLGKTMQVLALLLVLRRPNGDRRSRPSVIVAPASLVANWESEVRRFAPSLRTFIAHPSVTPTAELQSVDSDRLRDIDLVLTSYGTLARTPALGRIQWEVAVLDEAQAIKNPSAKQTRSVKQLDARARIALTGTPVENRVGDLWSIFDFINAGLLGNTTEFGRFTRQLAANPQGGYPTFEETTTRAIEACEAAWEFFGGIFKVVIPDNTSAIVTQADPLAPRITLAFLEYAQARAFHIDPARVRHPRDKGRVERAVQTVRDDCFAGEILTTLDDARTHATQWCRDDYGLRRHSRTQRAPREYFETEEQPVLLPPPTTAYEIPLWSEPKVARDQHVQVAKALYSLPRHFVGRTLRARADPYTVRVYDGLTLVKTHARQPPGGRATDPADFPAERSVYALRDVDALRRQAASYGDAVGRFAAAILDGPLPWTRMRRVYALLGLARRYGATRVNDACTIALAAEMVDVHRLKRMLALGQAPATAGTPARVIPLGRFLRPASQYALPLVDDRPASEGDSE